MQAYRCRYCHRPIPPDVAQLAIERNMTPTYCRRSHNTLFKQRKRRLEARGLSGAELAKALAQRPNLQPGTGTQKSNAENRPKPHTPRPKPERRPDEPPTYAEYLQARKAGRTLEFTPLAGPESVDQPAPLTQGPPDSTTAAVYDDVAALLS